MITTAKQRIQNYVKQEMLWSHRLDAQLAANRFSCSESWARRVLNDLSGPGLPLVRYWIGWLFVYRRRNKGE